MYRNCFKFFKKLERHWTDIVYLHFMKAFDSVCNQRLLSKLKWFGIDGPLLRWFETYLTGRMQRVVLKGSSSSSNVVISGVSQGSLMGSSLFLIYINDMPQVFNHRKLAIFADDSKCFKIIKSNNDFLDVQHDLNSLQNWSTDNEIFFQPSKGVNFRITRKR